MANPIVSGLLEARQREHTFLAAEYRKLIWALADGEAPDRATTIDMLDRLGISDTDFKGDESAAREHRETQRALAEFAQQKPGIERQMAELTKQVADAQEMARKAADLEHGRLVLGSV